MTTKKTPIEKLCDAEKAMSSGPYEYDKRSGRVISRTAGPTTHLSKDICEMFVGNLEGNSRGLVALRNAAPALLELWTASERQRDAVCETQSLETDDYTRADDRGECAGENHIETCPVEIARQDVAAVLNKGLPDLA